MYVRWRDSEGVHSIKCSNEITAKMLYVSITDFEYKEVSNIDNSEEKNLRKYRNLAV